MDVVLYNIFDQNEELLCSYLYDNMIIFIHEFPNDIANIHFDDIFYENMKELFKIFVEFYFRLEDKNLCDYYDIIHDEFDNIWNITKKVFYKTVIPKRSFKYSFVRSIPNIQIIENKITILRNIPQPVQRTNEWYKFRHNLITASNAYKCLESETIRNNIIFEKCKPLEKKEENAIVNLNTPFHWGQKYEPLSVEVYEKRFNTKIEDFGCIPHSKYKFLGASPDGINIDKSSDRYGRMLEIKNIFNRDIIEYPKKEYWIQMQLQMEVCDLNECDFLETRFKEYTNYEEFILDGSFTHTLEDKEKGIMILFINDNKPVYEYAPLGIDEISYVNWEKDIMNKHCDNTFVSIIYWRLDEFSCKLVLRNKKWFNLNISSIKETWDIIEKERITGYDHRAPVKRIKKEKQNAQGCLINIDGSIKNVEEDKVILENQSNDTLVEDIKKEQKEAKLFKVHTESFDESHIIV